MRGLVLAGGTGSRLWPITKGVSKQLLPVYDKPMIYYPISTLMLAGIRHIGLITTPEDASAFKRLLGDGAQWGIQLTYFEQSKPRGIAESFLIAEDFIAGRNTALVLGDNIFHGAGFGRQLESLEKTDGAQIFAYEVANPRDYGVVEMNDEGIALSIQEKPLDPKSNLAVPGIYFYGNDVVEKVKTLAYSDRDELEISDLNSLYLAEKRLRVSLLPRGTAWLDTGTVENLNDAAAYVRILEHRQGLKVGCIEEIAWRQGWISDSDLKHLASNLVSSGYGRYLLELLSRGKA
jgi:glucose-1-phosphate thymidylyltransferase